MALTSKGAALTDRHRRNQVRLAITADSQARRLWDSTLDLDDLKGSQPIWKNAMLNLLQTWWQVSAETAADYLPRFREAETGDGSFETAVPRFDRKRMAGQVDWLGATNVLWHIARGETQEAAYATARSLFLGVFHEAVLTGGRTTIEHWAKKDTRAIGWRRVSDGDPCAFCAMLVTRGPVYTSAEKAGLSAKTGKKYHPHCGCTVEVVYGDWKPSEQEQQWIDEYYRAAESLPDRTPRTAETVLPLMRRNGSFRDSRQRRSTPGYLKRRRQAGFDKRIARLLPEVKPAVQSPGMWANNVQPPNEKVISHILYGEGDGKRGGHLYGTNILGKTEFPQGWDRNRILDAIRQVMESPQWEIHPDNDRALHRFGGTVDGVQIEVKAYLVGGQYVIDRAMPIGGAGVTRNTPTGKIAVKRSKAKQWRESDRHDNG
ncbi:EndoU domain-containing protein [Bifidobacterium imperatoris]|uniref:EndoU domain-containing protein n=2 Tax=Bifidobacterium imperatoris TaxID=2020965 RepID=A0ABX7S398_9BIFI|nr:EndoU domain-containing protein [Bifidobacterium imperatoris]QSY58718.1 EndoU domain-containing protein [Bifidobacterium imperatoris]